MYEEEYDDDETEYYALRPNKTLIKRETAEISDFVKALMALSVYQLNQLELDEELYKAVTLATTTTKGAQKRQVKFIVGMLRKMDYSLIQDKLAKLQNKSAHAVREHHTVERWRDNLITGDDAVFKQLVDEHPEIDRQELRQLVRNAKKEMAESLSPKFSRLLYQYLKKILTQEPTVF